MNEDTREPRDQTRLVVRVPKELMERLERWAEKERYSSLSEAVRRSLTLVVDQAESRWAGGGRSKSV